MHEESIRKRKTVRKAQSPATDRPDGLPSSHRQWCLYDERDTAGRRRDVHFYQRGRHRKEALNSGAVIFLVKLVNMKDITGLWRRWQSNMSMST